MKTFKEFINEDKIENALFMDMFDKPAPSMLITRSQMPQTNFNFIDKIKKLPIDSEFIETVPNDSLKPTQLDFNKKKVNGLRRAIKAGIDMDIKPIIVSNDNYILDGHHRYIASKLEQKPTLFFKVDLDIVQLLKLAKDLDENE